MIYDHKYFFDIEFLTVCQKIVDFVDLKNSCELELSEKLSTVFTLKFDYQNPKNIQITTLTLHYFKTKYHVC